MAQKRNRAERHFLSPGQRRLVQRIAISVFSFLAAMGLSTLVPGKNHTELLWNISASVFVAGVTFIAQYLFEVERRLGRLERRIDDYQTQTSSQLARHAETTERMMTEGFSRIHLATELFGLREASQLESEEMAQLARLVRNRTKIATEATPLMQDFATFEITRLADYLKQIGDNSDLTYEGEDRDWLLGLTQLARTSIQATSLSTVDAGGRSFVNGGLWRSDLGQRYLDLQRQAIRRGVRIQRIFIIDREGIGRQDLDDVLRLHLGIGVQVRILDATAAPASLHARLRDFIVFDQVLSYQSTAASSVGHYNPIVVNTTLVSHRDRVQKRINEFADLWTAEDVHEMVLDEHRNVVPTPGRRFLDTDGDG